MHIVLASDNNYAPFVAVTLVSILRTNPALECLHVHLLANGVSDDTLQKIQDIPRRERLHLHVYDISNLREMLQVDVPDTIAMSCYARLFMADILPKDIDKVLYLDCDVVATASLKELWQTDMGKMWVAGVLDVLYNDEPKVAVGMQADEPYLNAGILLVNLKAWREECLTHRFLDFLLSHNGNVYHHDQGIINGICTGHTLTLHPRYNMTSSHFSHPGKFVRRLITPYYTDKELAEGRTAPALIHFTEGFYNRPWKRHCNHPKKQLFFDNLRLTPWHDMPLQPDTRARVVRLLSWEFVYLPLWVYKMTQWGIGVINKIMRR